MDSSNSIALDSAKAINARLSIAFSNIGHVFTHVTIILYATAVLHLPNVF